MAPPGPSQRDDSGLSSKINAAPFVPGASAAPLRSPQASGLNSESAKAQIFVPLGAGSGGKAGAGGPGQGHHGAGRPAAAATKLVASAVAFVPKQPEPILVKGGRGPGAEAPAGTDAPVVAVASSSGGRGAGPAPAAAPAPAPPAAGARGASAGRGGGRGGGGGGAPANQFPAGGRAAAAGGGGGPGRGGRGSAATPGGGNSNSPAPMPGRGGGRGGGGRGGGGGGGGAFMGGGGGGGGMMHHSGGGGGMMMGGGGGGFGGGGGGGHMMGQMGPMPPMVSYGAGGGSHLPSYRSRDPYLAGPGRSYVGLHFVEEGLRQQLQHRAYMTAAQWHGDAPDDPPAPSRLGPYHTLYPLEEGAMGAGGGEMPSAALGLRSALVKGVSALDGAAAALRRVDPKQVIPTAELLSRAREAVESWAPLANHPNLVGLRAAFLAADSLAGGAGQQGGGGGGGDGASALVFAHDFHAGAVTLAAAHLMPQMNPAGLVSAPQPPPEEVVWSYAVQLTSALRAAHGCGLLLRPACLHPTKVLLTGFGRLRVGSVGVVDALMGGEQPGPEEVQMLMRQDITAMGSLLLALCCAGAGPAPSLDTVVAAHYSPELARLLGALLAAADGGPLGSWRGLVAALADRAFTELDGAGVALDHTIGELSKEVENGRLLRLLAKINFVTERPSEGTGQEGDSSWSETGDRYLLKLFRDFVFHAATPDTGAPLLDWGLVVEALNKLDAGVHEEVLLLGRDGQSMLVVTYADVKRCLDSAFSELKAAASMAAAAAASTAGRGGGGGGAGRAAAAHGMRM